MRHKSYLLTDFILFTVFINCAIFKISFMVMFLTYVLILCFNFCTVHCLNSVGYWTMNKFIIIILLLTVSGSVLLTEYIISNSCL